MAPRRRVHILGLPFSQTSRAAAYLDGAWIAQQARNLFMSRGDRIGLLRFLIPDFDACDSAQPGPRF
jgi:hypothetical protein